MHAALNLLRRLRGAWGMPYGAACGALSIAGVQVLIAKMEAETDPTKRLVAANEKAVSARAASRAWASHTVRVCVCVCVVCVCVRVEQRLQDELDYAPEDIKLHILQRMEDDAVSAKANIESDTLLTHRHALTLTH